MVKCGRDWVKMSELLWKVVIFRGIMKWKGICSWVCIRNRLKMDKIREFLKSLKIEGDLSLWSWFYDCDLDVWIYDKEFLV